MADGSRSVRERRQRLDEGLEGLRDDRMQVGERVNEGRNEGSGRLLSLDAVNDLGPNTLGEADHLDPVGVVVVVVGLGQLVDGVNIGQEDLERLRTDTGTGENLDGTKVNEAIACRLVAQHEYLQESRRDSSPGGERISPTRVVKVALNGRGGTTRVVRKYEVSIAWERRRSHIDGDNGAATEDGFSPGFICAFAWLLICGRLTLA